MRLIYTAFILLLALITSAQCQQTVDYWINELLDLHDQGKYDEAIKAYIGVINDSYGIIRLSPGDLDRWVIQGDYVRRHNAINAYRDAIMIYDEAIRLDPNDVVAWYNKGIALKTLGMNDMAIECFDEAIRLNPNNAGPWTGKGVALYFQGNVDDAIKCFDEAIKLDHNDSEAWSNKGAALRSQGKYNEAIQALDKAIRLDPDIADAWIIKGDILFELNKFKESSLSYENATRLNSVDKWEWHRLGLGFGDLAEYYEDMGDRTKAIEYYIKSNECYEHTIELNGGNITNPSGIDLEHNIVGVRTNLQRLIRLTTRSPQTAEDWFNEGKFFYCLIEYDEAIKAFNEAIKLNSTEPKYWDLKGLALCFQGKYDEAFQAFNEAIRLDPNLAEPWINKGDTFNDLSKYDEAIKAYDEAIKLNPNNAEAWQNKGYALEALKRANEANAAFAKAKELGYLYLGKFTFCEQRQNNGNALKNH